MKREMSRGKKRETIESRAEVRETKERDEQRRDRETK